MDDLKTQTKVFICDQNTQLVIEDNARVVYAYVIEHESEVSGDVWLYNKCDAPTSPEWRDPEKAPFANPAAYVLEIMPFEIPADVESLQIIWDAVKETATISLGDFLVAIVGKGNRPGWSACAKKDGPLARKLDLKSANSQVEQ